MTQAPPAWKPRPIPDKYKKSPLSPEEKARQKAESQDLWRRCRPIFEGVRENLIKTHYNWYIAINPNSGEYFLEEDELSVIQKLLENPPKEEVLIGRLNETGTCGQI
jgi:hypothetical protein